MVNENFFPWGTRPCQQINLYYLVSLKNETQILLDKNFKALDELGNERIELDMCWIPLEDVPGKNIYPPQAKECIVNPPPMRSCTLCIRSNYSEYNLFCAFR